MSVYSYADCVGTFDGRAELFCESVYLLNEDYTVVGKREASTPDAPTPEIGDRFFDHFKASPEERAMLKRMSASISRDSLLIRAGGRPVMMLCQLFARTRLIVAVVLQGEIRACLEAPAAYADVLEQLHVQLSGEARVLGEPLDSYRYAVLCEWLQRVHIPFLFEGRQPRKADADVTTLTTRLSHLALLCGCLVEYDLSHFGYEPLTDDFDLLTGTLLATLLMVHRVGKERSVLIDGGYLYGEGPVLRVLFDCDASIASLPELEVLRREAVTRDDLFAVYHAQNGSFPLALMFSFCSKELSAQDIKVKILFGEESNAVRTYSVTDEEIADMQNEINASKQ